MYVCRINMTTAAGSVRVHNVFECTVCQTVCTLLAECSVWSSHVHTVSGVQCVVKLRAHCVGSTVCGQTVCTLCREYSVR